MFAILLGSMVKRLRHRPFTAVTRVRFPSESYADVAQLAEQLICNQQVIGSSPIIGFTKRISVSRFFFCIVLELTDSIEKYMMR